jgi:hypothetical protein
VEVDEIRTEEILTTKGREDIYKACRLKKEIGLRLKIKVVPTLIFVFSPINIPKLLDTKKAPIKIEAFSC